MSKVPSFYVPEATPDNEESIYAEFANRCNRPVPKKGQRIYSITFVHDKTEWVATIGECLKGVQARSTHSKGKKIERTQNVSDPAVVLAIFPGVPYMVVTNHGIAGNVGSKWVNPFMAGIPKSITYFSAEDVG